MMGDGMHMRMRMRTRARARMLAANSYDRASGLVPSALTNLNLG